MREWVWNTDRTKVVDIDHIRSFSIEAKVDGFQVLGWFSDTATILFGSFKDLNLAQMFLRKLLTLGDNKNG